MVTHLIDRKHRKIAELIRNLVIFLMLHSVRKGVAKELFETFKFYKGEKT